MKKIDKEVDRLVTFSKRRSGINKKASELVTLCGAEVGVVVFSPAAKPFSFGHPSVESVANRFLNKTLHNPKRIVVPILWRLNIGGWESMSSTPQPTMR